MEPKLLLFLPFSPCNQGYWNMYQIKIELSIITYSFQLFFKYGLKLLLFCCFPIHQRCTWSKFNCLKLPKAFKSSLNWNYNLWFFFAIFPIKDFLLPHPVWRLGQKSFIKFQKRFRQRSLTFSDWPDRVYSLPLLRDTPWGSTHRNSQHPQV